MHICCSVDSHYFIQRLQKEYPNEKLIGYFYDPNIHPYSEYRLRLFDVKRSCDILGIELIEGEYDIESWYKATRGYENEPEKGLRCSICFEHRFEISAKKASELKESIFTSTLLISPKKSIKQLTNEGNKEASKYNIKFLSVDYRKGGGTQKQMALAKEDMLYHQNYCGCFYALKKQREQQRKIDEELFNDISNRILPGSIEQRLELYALRVQYEHENISYKIVREKFLNYKILNGFVKLNKKVIPSYFLPYSITTKEYTKTKIVFEAKDIHYLNKDEIKIVSLDFYNSFFNTSYGSVYELIYNPQDFNKEIEFRQSITGTHNTLSTILVLDRLSQDSYEIYLKSEIYNHTKEVLIKI